MAYSWFNRANPNGFIVKLQFANRLQELLSKRRWCTISEVRGKGPHVPNIVLSCHSSGVFHVVAILAQLRDLDGLLGIYRTLLLFSFRHTCGKPGRTDYAWITSRPPDIPFLAVFLLFFAHRLSFSSNGGTANAV